MLGQSSCVGIDESDERFLHHIFAVDTHYGCTAGRFDSIMVEADKTKAFAHGNGRKSFFWFAKALAFVRINHRRDTSVKCGIHDRMSCSGL